MGVLHRYSWLSHDFIPHGFVQTYPRQRRRTPARTCKRLHTSERALSKSSLVKFIHTFTRLVFHCNWEESMCRTVLHSLIADLTRLRETQMALFEVIILMVKHCHFLCVYYISFILVFVSYCMCLKSPDVVVSSCRAWLMTTNISQNRLMERPHFRINCFYLLCANVNKVLYFLSSWFYWSNVFCPFSLLFCCVFFGSRPFPCLPSCTTGK